MNNYKYCSVKNTCIKADIICNNATKEREFTNVTGCPITQKCDLGLNGTFFIDTGNAASGGLDTSVDNHFRFLSFNASTIAKSP